MRLLHSPARTRAVFDDPNLLPSAGLVPLLALAGRAGLPGLLAGVRPGGPCGANAVAKAMCLVAGMAAGADSIEDMDLLRDGAVEAVFGGVRAPSTLGSHLPIRESCRFGRYLRHAARRITCSVLTGPRLGLRDRSLPGRASSITSFTSGLADDAHGRRDLDREQHAGSCPIGRAALRAGMCQVWRAFSRDTP